MKLKKYFALALACAMLTPQAGLALEPPETDGSAAWRISARALPQVGEIIYQDDFEAMQPDSRWEITQDGSGTLEQAEGRLSMTRTSTASAATKVNGFFLPDKSVVSGKIGVSFDLYRSAESGMVQLRFQGRRNVGSMSPQDYTSLMWSGDKLSSHFSEQEGAEGKGQNLPGAYPGDHLKVDLEFNTVRSTLSMWIDGTLIADNKYQRFPGLQNLDRFYMFLEREDFLTVSLDNFMVYRVYEEVLDPALVQQDFDALTQDSTLKAPLPDSGYLIDSLELPSKGANGSEITWSSTDEAVIAKNGKVVRPQEDAEVTLTAEVSSGETRLSKSFPFRVAGARTNVDGMPGLRDMVYEEDFSDGVLDGRIKLTQQGGTIQEAGGKLTLSRTENTGNTIADIYLDPAKAAQTGQFVTEFILNRADKKKVNIRMRGNGGADYLALDWQPGGEITAMYMASPDAEKETAVNIPGSFDSEYRLKVTALYNTEEKSVSVWLNNKPALDGVYARKPAVAEVVYARIYLEGANLNNATVDDFKYYTVMGAGADQELVDADLAALTQDSILKAPLTPGGMLIDNLELPAKGKNGSKITWASSPEGVISPDGRLTRPAETKEVALTAEVRSGSVAKETRFTFTVPAARLEVDGLPAVLNMQYEEDFDDGVLSPHIVATQKGGTVTEADGKLKVTRTENLNETIADIYLDQNKKEQTGIFVTEYTLRRDAAQRVVIRMRGAGGDFIGLDWNADGALGALYSEEQGVQGGSHTIEGDFDNLYKMKLTMKFNTVDQSVTLWVNNKLALEKVYARIPAVKSLVYARLYTEKNTYFTFTVDDFKYYTVKVDMPDQERVDKDFQALRLEDMYTVDEPIPGMVSADLDLARLGLNGSDITWTTSDASLITAEGRVTRPGAAYDTDPEVTLTAVLRSGGVEKQKEFRVKVVRASVDLDAKPEVREMIYENDFSSPDLDDRFTLDSSGGAIQVNNGALEIKRSENSGTTIADIYLDRNKNAVKGLVGVEYTLTRTSKQNVQQRLRTGGANDYVAITWGGSGSVSFMYANEYAGATVSSTSAGVYPDQMRVRVLMNTDQSKFSLWINDQIVLKDKYSRAAGAKQMQYVRIYLEGASLTTVKLDDFKAYYAWPPSYSRAAYDAEWLTDSRLLTKPYISGNIIDADLTLPALGEYQSNIQWTSSMPEVIAESGKVTRPLDAAENPEVTLTARLSFDGFVEEKTFTFRVLRDFSNDEERLKGDMQDLTVGVLTSDPAEGLVTSLNLPEMGLYGSAISWKSGNTDVITNSGRVIRPRSDEGARQVELTATLSGGSQKAEKTFVFTVLPDEEYADPDWMSDEEFFGKWSGGEWATVGKFDYARAELKGIEAAAKAGDYAKAKEELLSYMRSRNVESPIGLAARNPGWANMVIAGVHNLQGSKYYQGDGMVSAYDYAPVYMKVNPGNVAKGGSTTYNIIARYNEISEAVIASMDHPDPGLRPKMELVVNGQTRTYDAVADATIRAGKYAEQNYGTEPELRVKMFGEFMGDETYRSIIRFNFGDLLDTDKVTSARLVVNAKVGPSFADPKSLLVIFEPTNTWKQETVNWNALTGYVYNFNGIPGGNHWDAIPGCDVEYTYQAPRFLAWRAVASEYAYTKDEKYAYHMIRDMMDFIWDKGGPIKYNGGGWGTMTLRGGYPRTLDTAERLRQWVAVLNTLSGSSYMTPEACSAILKNIWDMNDNLTKSTVTQGNWIQNEQMAVIQGALSMPEFAKSEEWIAFGQKRNEELIYINNFPDGSYIEATGGYNIGAYGSFLDFKRLMANSGREVSPEYDEMLRNAAYYNLLLRGPNGANLQYGDEGAGKSTSQKYPELVTWYDDHEIEFIDSLGKKGTKPEWTSRMFPDSRVALMRSDWKTDALFMFTNVRGGGQHGHADDNSVTVIAYDRTLINDAGIFTYTSTDPYRIWGLSTRAHNTVEINNKSQRVVDNNQGVTHDWVTNDNYDFISQSTKAYESIGFDHRRSITFVKPNFWIVSDLMTPDDLEKENEYKQIWHMLPAAGLQTDDEQKTIYSTYKSGANIIVASADQDVKVTEEEGWYDYNYQQLESAPFAYYERSKKGKATYDTVLMPYPNGEADIDVERIDLGVDTSVATAMKFRSEVQKEVSNVYYLLDYQHDANNTRTFDKYATNGKLSLVREDKDGKIKELILNDGSKITTAAGKLVLDTDKAAADIGLELVGATLNIKTADEKLDLNKVRINLGQDVDTVTVNGKTIDFTVENVSGDLLLTDKAVEKPPVNDPSNGGGGIKPGGGGEVVPTPVPTPTPTPTPTPVPAEPFVDIDGHWAKEYIEDIRLKGIVKGDSEGRFHPDNPISRGELTAMVVRAAGLGETEYAGGFEDVSVEDWYAGVIQTALDKGLIASDRAFRPRDNITREEMSKIIAGTARLLQGRQDPPEEFRTGYTDENQISGWADEFVRFVSYHGLMSGMEDGSFRPAGAATRAEVATVISRMLKTE